MDTTSEESVDVKPVAKKTTAKKTAAKKTTAKKTTAKKTTKKATTTLTNDEGQEVISVATPSSSRTSNTVANDDNVIGSRAADRALQNNEKAQTDYPVPTKKAAPKKPDTKDENKVAIWSARNLRWTGVGQLSTGYNIVTEEAAEKWLGRQGVRKASPEELSTYYGN